MSKYFNPLKKKEDGSVELYASDVNKKYRISLQEKYDNYVERVNALAYFFHWSEEKTRNAIAIPNWNTEKVWNRIQQLEDQMNRKLQSSQLTIEEKRRENPNAVIFQIIDKNNIDNTYSISSESNNHSMLLDGLVFRTYNVSNSPFKTKENVEFIKNNYTILNEEQAKIQEQPVQEEKVVKRPRPKL